VIVTRAELPSDVATIHRVNELAFGRADEAAIVDALRENGALALSFVAIVDDEIVGHIAFSPVEIARDGGTDIALGLAPMAVLPSHQRRGVGSRLVRDALDELRRAGHHAVVVLGHPEYYPRFGFERASRFGLSWEHPAPDDAFMALELSPGALAVGSAVVRFRPELASE
jgi:putative acetyltransferase